jgi:hypothetical protein
VVGVVFSELDVGALSLEFTVLLLQLKDLLLIEILSHIKLLMCVDCWLIQTIQDDRLHELFITASLLLKVIQVSNRVHFFWYLLKLILALKSRLFFYNSGTILQSASILCNLGSGDKRVIRTHFSAL